MSRIPLRPAQLAFAVALALSGAWVHAQGTGSALSSPAAVEFNIAAKPLGQALGDWAMQTQVQLIVQPELVGGKSAPGVAGRLTARQALDRLLAGSGLVAVLDGNAVVIRTAPPVDASATLAPMTVTAEAERAGSAGDGYRTTAVSRAGPWEGRSLQDTPYAISVISSELIENIQATSVDQMFKINPVTRLTDSQARVDLAAPVLMRGFAAGSTALNGYKRGWTNVGASTEDIERVEILTGMSGFLYGAGNVGGVINYVTKRPTPERYNAIHVGNTSGANAYVHGDFGGPIDAQGRLGYRLNVVRQAGESQIDDFSTRRTQYSAALDWKVTNDLLIQFDLNKRDYFSTGGLNWFTLGTGVKRPSASALDPDKQWTQSWNSVRVDSERYGVNARWTPNERFTLRGGYMTQRDERQYSNAQSYLQANNTYGQYGSQQGTQYLEPSGGQVFADYAFETGPISHKLTAGYYATRVSVGASLSYWSNEVTLFTGHPLAAPAPKLPRPAFTPVDTSPHFTQTIEDNKNWMIGDDIRFTEHWSALVGANHTTIVSRGFNQSGEQTSRYRKSATTPTLSLIFKPVDSLTTYASYIKALEQGGTAADTYNGYRVSNAKAVMPPMESRQLELGAKWSVNGLLLTGALYEIDKALQYYDLSIPTQPTYVQDGRQVHRGVEMTGTGKLGRNLTLVGGLTWLDAKVREQKQNPALEGKRPTGVSGRTAKLYVEYALPAVSGLALVGGVYYNGPFYVDTANTEKLGGYTTLDAGLRYESRLAGHPLAVRVNINNLSDKRYWASGNTIGAGRTLTVSASYKF